MDRRKYKINITVNERKIDQVVIDSHYEEKHKDISDEIILALVKTLDKRSFRPIGRKEGYEYFLEDMILLDGKNYKLIWLLEDREIYIGVVNCYRRD